MSGLAVAARALISSRGGDGAAAGAATITLIDASASGGEATLYVDREPAVTHLVVEWLRDGPSALERVPNPVLEQLSAEAAHWKMTSLTAQLTERLGKPDAATEGMTDLEWTIGQLEVQHVLL